MLNENIKRELEYQALYDYLDKYKNEKLDVPQCEGNGKVIVDKTIWIFWLQGIENAPLIVRKCIQSVISNKPVGYELVILTESNLKEYVELPYFIWEKYYAGNITTTHLSDIIRAELLYMYGGAWIDATVYCSDKIPLYMLEGDMFMFKTSNIGGSVLKGSSWWIYAKRGEKVIADTRELLYKYWNKEEKMRNYFLFHIALSKVIDDSSYNKVTYRNIPSVCNSNPHNLWGMLPFEFDEEKWEIIKSNSVIHKLSYKRKFLQGDIYSFYIAFLKGKLR